MQELDKLEKLMNVDACAAVVEKADGPRKQVKRPNKYVFTIKIVEAEDLKACDPNGTSDPYVVLGDEYQKRLAKTRVVMRNLNPRWDESVDITVTGPLNVVATIWDYDTFGDHDFVGRTSLKLDPLHFSDYLPREFWLELDTQGRILLRVSMEGERDDIQFYFGKAFRILKRAERDMVRGITDKVRKPSPWSMAMCANMKSSLRPISIQLYPMRIFEASWAGTSCNLRKFSSSVSPACRLLPMMTSRMRYSRFLLTSTQISPS